jgi:4-hydroxybenzoate polyprenyltransferase
MADESSKPSRLLAWLQLMRLPNVFTAMADVAMGFWLTHESLSPLGVFLLLLISSGCLYIGGMILNDGFDLEQDRRERPNRPLPSGRISARDAVAIGRMLLVLGVIFAYLTMADTSKLHAGLVASVLALLIYAYDYFLKRTPLGTLAMGGCRFLNVLLGMSASLQPWTVVNFIVAGGIGVYIVGVTWFARKEAAASPRAHLIGGFFMMLAGIALLWSFPKFLPSVELTPMLELRPQYWALLWIVFAALIGWRFVRAITRPQPALVQRAVKNGILSIIMLDATAVLGMRGCWPAIAVLLLLVPAIVLGRWVYST